MDTFFKKAKQLSADISEFLDCVSEGALIFHSGVKCYLAGNTEEFLDKISQVAQRESAADKLRRRIEKRLYGQSLIPEHRGDVLGLLETMDHIVDALKKTLNQFDVEHPQIPENLHSEFLALTEAGVKAAEMIVRAARSFFINLSDVENHLHKVYYFEKEADRISDHIKRKIFATDLDLSQKMHIRYFVHHTEGISDRAEEVADRLAIYTIKRRL